MDLLIFIVHLTLQEKKKHYKTYLPCGCRRQGFSINSGMKPFPIISSIDSVVRRGLLVEIEHIACGIFIKDTFDLVKLSIKKFLILSNSLYKLKYLNQGCIDSLLLLPYPLSLQTIAAVVTTFEGYLKLRITVLESCFATMLLFIQHL